jgi:uncharacterized protein YegL
MSKQKKIIHAVSIIDRSGSMTSYRSRTIEGINTNIAALKAEVDADTEIINTQLQFASLDSAWNAPINTERDFIFTRVGVPVQNLVDMTEADYVTGGGTPLIDAIGHAIEKVKEFHGDKLGDDNLKIIVTVFTDGEENSSQKWKRDDVKKMIEHFQSDGKWTFTFVGCGSFDSVSNTSTSYGISASNTVAYADSDLGRHEAYSKIATSYSNFTRAAKRGVVDNDLFTEKAMPEEKK